MRADDDEAAWNYCLQEHLRNVPSTVGLMPGLDDDFSQGCGNQWQEPRQYTIAVPLSRILYVYNVWSPMPDDSHDLGDFCHAPISHNRKDIDTGRRIGLVLTSGRKHSDYI